MIGVRGILRAFGLKNKENKERIRYEKTDKKSG